MKTGGYLEVKFILNPFNFSTYYYLDKGPRILFDGIFNDESSFFIGSLSQDGATSYILSAGESY